MQPSLLDLQRVFRRAVFDGDDGELAAGIVAGGLAAAERIVVYRNNLQVSRQRALAADYPVVCRLVGEEFFVRMTRDYVSTHVSYSGDIGNYGGDFPEHIDQFPHAAALPYLGDVARLERAWNQVYLAAEVPPADPQGLARIAPERLIRLRFGFHPAVRLLQSQFPIKEIWHTNQPGYSGEGRVDLIQGGDCLLIRRDGDQVEILSLAPAEYAWLASLASDNRLVDAVDAAFSIDAEFELGTALQRHLTGGTFISYEGD